MGRRKVDQRQVELAFPRREYAPPESDQLARPNWYKLGAAIVAAEQKALAQLAAERAAGITPPPPKPVHK